VTTVEVREWLNPQEWTRDGRGRSWMFSVPTAEIVAALEEVAARDRAAFELLACSRLEVGRDSFSVYTPQPVARLSREGPWQYFVRSRGVTVEVPPPEPLAGVGWPAVFAVNGLVLLHHPDPASKDERRRSTLGIAHRVVNPRTGERRTHHEYDRLFEALKRELNARARRSRVG
jgi:hypothetical protein